MTDLLHDHLTLGFRRGCVACAQIEADMALSKRSLVKAQHIEAGDSLWEAVMSGDPQAVPAYSRWMESNLTLHGIDNREGVAPLPV